MKVKGLLALLALFFGLSQLIAQQKIRVHNSGDVMYVNEISEVDSIKLDDTYAKFKISGESNTLNFQKILVDSLTFTDNTVNFDKIYIIYNGTDNATIINPYSSQGVSISAIGGIVTVSATSGISNLEYNLLGSSSNGSLTMTTDTPVNLVLNNLTLTNPSGAAFNISGAQTTNILLKDGTTSTLSDGTASTKNGAITTNGPVVIKNTGTLYINGLKKHGINTSSSISVENGNISIVSAVSDGLHSEGFTMSSGNLSITSLSDGIDAGDSAINISGGTISVISTTNDVKAIKTGTNTISISGGNITLNVSGAQSKGISAKGNITIDNGTFDITISGATVLTASGSGYDPSYCTGIKTDGNLTINDGAFTLQSLVTADGGKGFSCDGTLLINDGDFTTQTAGNGGDYINVDSIADSFSTTSFTSDTAINIAGGIFNITNTGNDGKGISSDLDVTISGEAQISITNSGASGKGIKADENVTFDGGNTQINVSGATVLEASGSGYDPSYPTGVKATGQIIINSGSINIQGSSTATGCKGLSADGVITVNDGTITITTAGNGAVYTNTLGSTDSYASAAITSDTNISIVNGTITTACSGTGGKGLKADGTITIGTTSVSPVLNITTTGARFLVSGTDYSHPKTIVAVGTITVNNGTNTINSTDDGIHSDTSITINGGNNIINAVSTVSGMGEGIEAPLINITEGITNVYASNDGINATYGTVSGGTEQNDNSNFNVSGGILIVAGTDAIDSNGNITFTGGVIIACGPTNQPEEAIDYNGTFLMNGGFLMAAGSNASMTKAMSNASTQRSFFIKGSTSLSASSLLHIRSTSGTELVTFKPKNAVYYYHFSSSSILGSTQYKIYFGGSYTGGNYVGNSTGWGVYTGGTYSLTNAVLKSTFTSQSSSTVTTVTF